MTIIIDIFLDSLAAYLIIGVFFSIYFFTKSGEQIDKGVKGTSWHFKLIILPGLILFWSVLLWKLLRKS